MREQRWDIRFSEIGHQQYSQRPLFSHITHTCIFYVHACTSPVRSGTAYHTAVTVHTDKSSPHSIRAALTRARAVSFNFFCAYRAPPTTAAAAALYRHPRTPSCQKLLQIVPTLRGSADVHSHDSAAPTAAATTATAPVPPRRAGRLVKHYVVLQRVPCPSRRKYKKKQRVRGGGGDVPCRPLPWPKSPFTKS